MPSGQHAYNGRARAGARARGEAPRARRAVAVVALALLSSPAFATVGAGAAPAPGAAVVTTTVGVPASGATVSGAIFLDASAASPEGIAKVAYQITGGSLTSPEVVATATPTEVGWIAGWATFDVPNGAYDLESVATTTAGTSTSSAPVLVTVDNDVLQTDVLVPAAGTPVSGTSVVLDAGATGSSAVTSVSFVLSGGSLSVPTTVGTATQTVDGWIATWDSLSVPNGTYTLQSVADDAAGEAGSSPGITITVANPTSTTALQLGSSPYGQVLFTSGGRALYVFSADTVGGDATTAASSCSGACQVAWPPLTVSAPTGDFSLGAGIEAGAVGTIVLPGGAYQVTYFGHPLYLFAKDAGVSGATLGENVGAFDGIWHLVNGAGQPDAGVATVALQGSADGTILTSPTASGIEHSLYELTTDSSTASTCVATCATVWPPLLSTGSPVAGAGVTAALLGTVARADGTMQVTYDGHPLYFYSLDLSPATPGATEGEYLVDPFAHGVWYNVTPAGLPEAGTVTVTTSTPSIDGTPTVSLGFTSQLGIFTLYGFSLDTATSSACLTTCATDWPPLLTTGVPVAGPGVDPTMLGTITRSDGTAQVTYGGHPLYFFAFDQPGAAHGEAISAFGGVFDAVSPSGSLLTP